ncbi:MAG: HesB/IscA family protein [Pseudomonadales bacterium]
MSVESFDPTTLSADEVEIKLSESAKTHIEAQIAKAGQQHIRLGVEESGCNGYKYRLDFIAEPSADDQPMGGAGNWHLYVRQADLPLVNGTEVIVEVEGLNRSLKFKNPNAESHCGCGESFSIG